MRVHMITCRRMGTGGSRGVRGAGDKAACMARAARGGARNAQGVSVRRPRSDAHQHAAADRRGACAATDKLAYSRGTGAQVAPGDLAVACSIQEIEPLPQSLQLLLVDCKGSARSAKRETGSATTTRADSHDTHMWSLPHTLRGPRATGRSLPTRRFPFPNFGGSAHLEFFPAPFHHAGGCGCDGCGAGGGRAPAGWCGAGGLWKMVLYAVLRAHALVAP